MKKVLSFDNDFTNDYQIIAVSSHLKDYKLCWNLNNILKTDLLKKPDMAFAYQKGNLENYSFFYHHDEDLKRTYFLLSNKKNNAQIIEKIPEADFLLIINPPIKSEEINLIIQNLKKTTNILTAFLIDITKKKKEINFVLNELEMHYLSVKMNSKTDLPKPSINED